MMPLKQGKILAPSNACEISKCISEGFPILRLSDYENMMDLFPCRIDPSLTCRYQMGDNQNHRSVSLRKPSSPWSDIGLPKGLPLPDKWYCDGMSAGVEKTIANGTTR